MLPFSKNKNRNTKVEESQQRIDDPLEEDDSIYDEDIDEDEDEDYINYIESYNNFMNHETIKYIEENNKTTNNDSLTYKYDAIQSLEQTINSDITSMDTEFTVHICGYQVNTHGYKPFLQYFMHKSNNIKDPLLKNSESKSVLDSNLELMTFPHFQYKPGGTDIMLKCMMLLDIIFFSYKQTSLEYIYKGFQIDNSQNIYLFFDCSSYNIDSHKLSRMNDVWLILIDEIINHKYVCNFRIDEKVTQFFDNHPNLLLLQDVNGENIEPPTVAYIGCHNKMVEFCSVFGSPKNKYGYYTFTDYKKAIEQGGYKDQVKINGGIIRFAIFLGSMNILQDTDNMFIPEENDSVYQSIEDNPYWNIKTYEQQYVLSHHYIDVSTLGNVWSRETAIDYYIS